VISKGSVKLTDAVADCDLTAKNLNQNDLRRRANGGTTSTGNISLAAMKGSICALQTLVDNADYNTATNVGWSRRYTGSLIQWNSPYSKVWGLDYESSNDRLEAFVYRKNAGQSNAMSGLIYGYCNQAGTIEVKWRRDASTCDTGGKPQGNVEILGFASGYLAGASKQYEQDDSTNNTDYTKRYTSDPSYPYFMVIPRALVRDWEPARTKTYVYYKNISARLL
jgi:hypothetical protein